MHYVKKCKHGITMSQCRCPSPEKQVRLVECDHPDTVPAHAMFSNEAVAHPVPEVKLPWSREVTDMQLSDVISLVREEGLDEDSVVIEYGSCGSHEVWITEKED